MSRKVNKYKKFIFVSVKCFGILKKRDFFYNHQGSKGVRQWLINGWTITSLMIIHKITPPVAKNLWQKHLNTQINKQTNQIH